MGIGWLWYFTHSGDTDPLRTLNEHNAAAIHARWRAVGRRLEGLGRLRDRWREKHLERATRRELAAMSDHLLRDLGLWHVGTAELVDEPRRSSETTRRPRPAACGGAPAAVSSECAAPPTVRDAPRDDAIDVRTRAA